MNYNSFNVIYDRNKNDIGNCNCNDKKLVGIILGYYNQGFDVLSKHLDLWLGYDKEILDSFQNISTTYVGFNCFSSLSNI